jgi:CRP-like cAMP-binding protein
MTLQQLLETIPTEELAQFDKQLRIAKAGDNVISEGEPNDNTLYLLRAGKIGVYRNVNNKQEQTAEMEALAFFGEMELMDYDGFRLATCSVISEFAIFYAFTNPDIKTIIKNSTWGEILVTRLCQDLRLLADRNVQYQLEILRLKAN